MKPNTYSTKKLVQVFADRFRELGNSKFKSEFFFSQRLQMSCSSKKKTIFMVFFRMTWIGTHQKMLFVLFLTFFFIHNLFCVILPLFPVRKYFEVIAFSWFRRQSTNSHILVVLCVSGMLCDNIVNNVIFLQNRIMRSHFDWMCASRYVINFWWCGVHTIEIPLFRRLDRKTNKSPSFTHLYLLFHKLAFSFYVWYFYRSNSKPSWTYDSLVSFKLLFFMFYMVLIARFRFDRTLEFFH